MRFSAGVLISLSLSLSVCAAAESVDFTIGAYTPNNVPETVSFTLNSLSYMPNNDFGLYYYEGVTVFVDGVAQVGTVDLYNSRDMQFPVTTDPEQTVLDVSTNELDLLYGFADNGSLALVNGNSLDGPPTIHPGTYSGFEACGYDQECSDLESSVTVTLPGTTAVSPEPGTFVLLGTGALGIAGALRRRTRLSW